MGRLTPELQKHIDRLYVAHLLPQRTPAGLDIDKISKDKFLTELDIQNCPTIAVEFAISEHEWGTGRALSWRDHIDRLHAITALPYVDLMATDDIELTGMIYSVKPRLPFPTANPIAKAAFDHLYM